MKLLWLPVLRLVHQAHDIRKAHGVLDPLSPGQWAEIQAFQQTTSHFLLTLRELARCLRLGADPLMDQGNEETRRASYEASSLIPLYVDLAFVYFRRLADHFARASRYALFRNAGSAPREYKKLRVVAADRAQLHRLAPWGDENRLERAFALHSGWVDKLRDSTDESGALQKGIRDIMEHHPAAVTFQHARSGDGPWEVSVHLGQPGLNVNFRGNLVPTLKEMVADLAGLWTMVCGAAGLPVAPRPWGVPYGDAEVLTGNDDDATHFWPESVA